MKKTLIALLCLLISNAAYSEQKSLIRIETSKGNIELELYPDKAPMTVKNFLRYIDEDFYKDTTFHRVIKNFMIQGGGFTKTYLKKETHATIANEAYNGLKNDRGSIAMARTNQPHSASSQFFINTANNKALNFTSQSPSGWGYTVFGKVISGMITVDNIEASRTGPGGVFNRDVPQPQVVIKSISRIKSATLTKSP